MNKLTKLYLILILSSSFFSQDAFSAAEDGKLNIYNACPDSYRTVYIRPQDGAHELHCSLKQVDTPHKQHISIPVIAQDCEYYVGTKSFYVHDKKYSPHDPNPIYCRFDGLNCNCRHGGDFGG